MTISTDAFWRRANRLMGHVRWVTGFIAATFALNAAANGALVPFPQLFSIPPDHFVALSFHEVDSDGGATDRTADGRYAVGVSQLTTQFDWLRANAYQPVSLDDILAARAGRQSLPPNAVLLSFDDGYADFYTRVYPLLKLYNYPAVIALVGSWLDAAPDATVVYDGKPTPRDYFMSWDQIREIVASGLVEVASHSYDLHHGLQGNPQGNEQPAAVSRVWDAATQRYETDSGYQARIRNDLERNSALIRRKLGKRPRAIVWPYGKYNGTTQAIASELGMPIALTLDDGPQPVGAPLDRVRRAIIEFAPGIGAFQSAFEGLKHRENERVVQVDLDQVFDADPAQQERNLSALLDRIVELRPSTVWLQAFADPDGDGEADATYFPNRHLPMRADLFNRTAWQLMTRAEVEVYAWMPLLAFQLPNEHPASNETVRAVAGHPGSSYQRLSPFSPLAREVIGEIYEDLARHSHFNGLLFHDDAIIGDYEDTHPAALTVYQKHWRLPGSVQAIRADPSLLARWSRAKTDWLIAFTHELRDRVSRWRAPVKLARNLYARPVLDRGAEQWYAQSLPLFLANYDRVGLMAMPYLEGASNPTAFLDTLIESVNAVPGGFDRTVFELQARDWKSKRPVPTAELAGWIRRLELAGARHIGYYPDDTHANQPSLDSIVPAFSARAVPRH
ncbi:MAG: poly-beta-1,6-N-acetyl-D-glucosamine N-deacetylase PgaB [Burkholderiaceae bacterium]